MDHADHVELIRAGVSALPGTAPLGRWLELGAGEGAITLALADLLGPGVEITAIDRDAAALRRLAGEMTARFPAARLTTVTADFARPFALAGRPYDGLLAANALHFVSDPAAVIARLVPSLRPAARVVVVEYDVDRGNPWVPHPFSYQTWQRIAAGAGLVGTREIGRVPSRFLGAIYAAASDRADEGAIGRMTDGGSAAARNIRADDDRDRAPVHLHLSDPGRARRPARPCRSPARERTGGRGAARPAGR